MPLAIIQSLRLSNRKLQTGVAGLQPGVRTTITAKHLTELLAELSRVADQLRSLPADAVTDTALQDEVGAYRGNLEQLKQVLPSLHARLFAEKARLEAARERVAAAAAWASTNRETL